MPEPKPRAASKRIWGYEVRDPYPGELKYFEANPHVGGMATEDNKITISPYTKLTDSEKQQVARNEAARLYMREQKTPLDFDPTPDQVKSFVGTPYENDTLNMRATLIARIITGDPSAGNATPEQKAWAKRVLGELMKRR